MNNCQKNFITSRRTQFITSRAKRKSLWKQRMQGSTADIKSNIGGQQEEKEKF
jgi:hypothetical protein